MKLTELQYERIKDVMPRQRGNVRLANLDLLNAVLHVAEIGCKWRALPKEFGNWNTVYARLNRWAKNGVLDRVFEALQQERLIHVKSTVASLASTIIKVHPDGTGALKKTGRSRSENREVDGQPKFIWLPRMLPPPIVFTLPPGQAGDAPGGESDEPVFLIMDRAYEGDETRELVEEPGRIPVVPSKAIALSRGSMIESFTSGAMELKDCSASSKDFGGWLPDMTSWTYCFLPSWFFHAFFWL